MKACLRPILASLAALLVVGGALGAHLLWFAADQRGPRWDELRVETAVLQILSPEAFAAEPLGGERGASFGHSEDRYPPLLPLLAVAWGALGEQDFARRRTLGVALALVTVLATFACAHRELGRAVATFAALVAAWVPFAFSYSHTLAIDNLLPPLVLLSLTLCRPEALGRPAGVIALGVALGLGCLAKWTFPIFMLGPMLALAVRHWRDRARALLAVLAIAGVTAGPWYAQHWSLVFDHLDAGALKGEDSWVSSQRGLKGWLFYSRELLVAGLGLPLAAAVGLGALRMVRMATWKRWGGPLLSLLVVGLVFSIVPTK